MCWRLPTQAIGGAELQSVYYGITGDDSEVSAGTDPYEKAKQTLSDHFAPKQHESYERFEFWTLKKGDDEPIEKYLIRIKQQAEKCYFGKTEVESRQIAILDKLNQNAPEELRRKLLEKQHLSLDDATRIVNSFQAIKYQAARMSQQTNATQINRVDFSRTSLNKNKSKMEYIPAKCAMCGFARHRDGMRCPAVGKQCFRCHDYDHLANMCPQNIERIAKGRDSNKRKWSSQRNQNYDKRPKYVHRVESEEEEDRKVHLSVYRIDDEKDEMVTCEIGGVSIEMLIDSGSTHNLIDDRTWEFMKMKGVSYQSERKDSTKRFLAYGRVPLNLLTVFDATLNVIDGNDIITADTTFYVIEGGQQPLLGKVTAQNLGLLRVGLPSCVNNKVNRVNVNKSFPKIKDFQLTLPIDDSIPAVIQPLRRCPIPMLHKVKEKLDELLSVGIIERVDKPSPWVSPLVPIIKDNGDLRLCVDMRKANKAIQRLNHPLPVFDNILPKLNGAKFFTTLDVRLSIK
ncbi:uncharacterized protein LOC129744294 [Uranotaenia lowii]|uniref:uncharacterized protein LOC129744294 n=1 Tax=Uranotaenia lowii TaxID=190385 RepID=UPI002478D122|nr:uncharacterized protein LOC129744294 [Uranotaenia lowii]XP_055592725.1 uncharacterized protein LOC129744294 [Uranotaenia lowii]XP_055592726.1 uncharacterized protein LOC129744294 [Uranotaenia lowii]